MAMRMGKHCFCQKPLTHTIYEARLMGEIAREKKVATQMGNQGTADDRAAQGGGRDPSRACSGTVKEVHVWTNRPIWPQGGPPPETPPVPPNLHWDVWLGPAPERPYATGLSSVRLARLVGFRHRRPGRHGLPHGQHALHGPRPARSRSRSSGRDLGPQQGQLSEVVDHQVRVPGQRLAAGREVRLVRRRQAVPPTGTARTAKEPESDQRLR